jgi:hypothetical protein
VARKTYKEMMASLEGLAKDSVEAAVAKRAAGGGPSARRAQKEGEGDVHEFMERMAELIVEEGEAKKGKERREARYKGTARGARAASSTAAAGTGAQAAAGAASAASAAAAAASGASNAPGAGATDGGAGASYAGASANYGAPTASTHAAGAEEVILFRGPCSTKWQLSWLCGLMTLTAGYVPHVALSFFFFFPPCNCGGKMLTSQHTQSFDLSIALQSPRLAAVPYVSVSALLLSPCLPPLLALRGLRAMARLMPTSCHY